MDKPKKTDPLDEHLSNPDPQFLKAAVQAIINEREAAELMAASWKTQWAATNTLLEKREERIEYLELNSAKQDNGAIVFLEGFVAGVVILFFLLLVTGLI